MTPAPQHKRHREVLTDVVRAYIETGEPVSSRSIAKHHQQPLSSATVRNVMADLEEEGFLYQPHTSAGRVPTAEAYRFFVEEVATQAIARPQDLDWIRREPAAGPTARGARARGVNWRGRADAGQSDPARAAVQAGRARQRGGSFEPALFGLDAGRDSHGFAGGIGE